MAALDATAIPTIVVSTPSTISKASTIPRRFSLPAAKPKPKSLFYAPFLNIHDKRAKKSALIVHDLIAGPPLRKHPRPQLKHLKSQLLHSKSANKLIAHLRALPAQAQGPIHAVCLAHPDAKVEKLHFSPPDGSLLSNIDVISLIGIGEPGNGKGLLAGALPTAETVLKGFQEITPRLMALGYATGKSVLIDHTGVYPPTDRMSVLTYWWGLELVFPPQSLQHLASAHSVTHTILNFLTALSLLSAGIRELLPFIRYIAQFIDFEFDDIIKQDRGRGVVCASTWIMPAALVARAWDFQEPPPETTTPAPATVPSPAAAHPADLNTNPPVPTTPTPPAPPTTSQPQTGIVNTIVGVRPEVSAP